MPKHSTAVQLLNCSGCGNYGGSTNPALRIHAINHARKGDDLANVLGAANPGDRAFEAEPEAGMRHAAVAAQIEIPLKRVFWKIVLAEALDEQIVIMNALAAADDFAITFGRQHVESKGQLGPLWVRLHVESFEGCGVAMNNHRAVERAGDDGFFVAPEVVAEFGGIAIFIENRDGFLVTNAREGRF